MSFPWQDPAVIEHTQHLLHSFHYWTGRSLLSTSATDPQDLAQQLFEVDFVVLSHGTQPDPVFNYGNQTALDLWEFDWSTLTQTPSRYSAEPVAREERERLLTQAKQQGYISDYQGVRISKSGRRFWIENVIIWDVVTQGKELIGQAATFTDWRFIKPT